MDEIKPSISKLARLIAIVVIVLSLVTTSIPNVYADSDTNFALDVDMLTSCQSELQKKLTDLDIQKELNLENPLLLRSAIEQQIVAISQEIDNIEEQIEICTANVNQCQNKINANQLRLEENHKQNCSRITSMSGVIAKTCTSSINNTNLSHLVGQISVAGQIAQDDKSILTEISVMKQEMDAAQDLLLQQNQILNTLKTDMVTKRQELYILMISDALVNDDMSKYTENIRGKQSNEMLAATQSLNVQGTKIVIDDTFPDMSGVVLKTNIDNNGIMWMSPCDYKKISSPFGYRTHPVYKEWLMHNGVDLTNRTNTPIYATRSGVVIDSNYDDSSGYHVVIDHLDGYKSYYLHLSSHSQLKVGDVVVVGDYIGPMGTTGVSTGTHLHFGISYKGDWVDPMIFIGN